MAPGANADELNRQILFHCWNQIEKYRCKTCPNSFQTNLLISLKNHIVRDHKAENSNGVYNCLRCLFSTSSKYLLVQHNFSNKCVKRDQNEKPNRSSSYKTDGTTFIWQQKFINDNYKNLTNCESKSCKTSREKPNKKTYTKWFECEQCSKNFKVRKDLNRHMICHAKPEEIHWFECGQCPSKFKRKYSIKSHVKTCHSNPDGTPRFVCEWCPSTFKQKGHLKTHTKSFHSQPEELRWFKCDQCPRKFKVRGDLNRHMICHLKPEEIRWFECDQCLSKFKRKSALSSHVKSFHSRPEDIRWFECEQCPSKFKHKGNLNVHVRLCHLKAEEIQWFECDRCPAKFKRNWGLKVHRRTCRSGR